MSRYQDKEYNKREEQILADESLTPKERSKALREAEEEIYSDPEEEARQAAEADGYSRYY